MVVAYTVRIKVPLTRDPSRSSRSAFLLIFLEKSRLVKSCHSKFRRVPPAEL